MKTLEYVSICKAARGVAGDYYDFLKIGADKLGMAIGDVSGKGIGAALLMASLQALLRSHAQQRGDDVGGLIGDMNKLMCASTDSNKYATFFYALYDDASRAFTYVNAGHNPPMLFRPATTTGTTVSDDLPALTDEPFDMIRLCHGGMVIGMFESAAYEQETVYLQSGDILVFFTDGVSEAMNVSEEEFGEQRISKIISSWPNATAKDLSNRVLQDLAAFVGDAPQYDDVTLIVARVY